MELKKNKKCDLESKRPLFFGIGMIISLSLTLLAFEWKSPIGPIVDTTPVIEDPWFMLEEPKVTKHEAPEMPEPKVEKQLVTAASKIKEVEELKKVLNAMNPPIDVDDIKIPFEKESKESEMSNEPFLVVENMPEFPGGESALMKFIAENIKYPKAAQRIGIEGRVTLSFIIDKDGTITDIEVLKGIGAGCDEEAIRVLKLLPKYSPGKQRGIPVQVRMQIPVNFKLQ